MVDFEFYVWSPCDKKHCEHLVMGIPAYGLSFCGYSDAGALGPRVAKCYS